ncbi:MAG: carboxylating nicotinate-nucleotide diphosphorylase [Kiritimatiellia bacterium]
MDIVRRAFTEDAGGGDVTSEAVIPEGKTAEGIISAGGDCVLSGIDVAVAVFHTADPSLQCTKAAEDGAVLKPAERVLRVTGAARPILAAERTALNFLQLMSGISTLTARFVAVAAEHGVEVLDTRKTAPTLRVLEKHAVRCGGGVNHRMGLHDRVLMKDNHLQAVAAEGSANLKRTVEKLRRDKPGLQIEIEVEREEQLEEILALKPDWILLDNMNSEQLRQCVRLCAGQCKLEASGEIDLDTLEDTARTGVNAVSVGRLTHSAPASPFSLEFLPGVSGQ